MTYDPLEVAEVTRYLRVAYVLMSHLKKYNPEEDGTIIADFSDKELHAWVVMHGVLNQFLNIFDPEMRDDEPES